MGIVAVQDLLAELIAISERSARISRLCRTTQADGLFSLLIQEKNDAGGKNPRFIQDFKTFADVLIQEVAKYYLETKFPAFSRRVYGEETNHFENKLGESIEVTIQRDVERTKKMLVKILDGNVPTANSLVQIIYEPSPAKPQDSDHLQFAPANLTVEQEDIAIWIDPIDSTSEYINGKWEWAQESAAATAISAHGLQCVTCLFGVFDTRTGLPLIGVLNQPFHKYKHHSPANGSEFSGRCLWGYNIDGVCKNNLTTLSSVRSNGTDQKSPLILVGGKESQELKEKLNGISQTMYVAGAGYKILCVISGEADLLVTSSKTTFFWDTCAGHAILRSLGGGIIALDDILQLDPSRLANLGELQLRYRSKDDQKGLPYNHPRGLVAYRCNELIQKTIQVLQS